MQIILPDKTMITFAPDPTPIEEILKRLEINPLSVIVVRNGMIVPEDVIVSGDDKVKIIRVSHGG